MSPTEFPIFASGAIAMGYVVATLFFLRFWMRTRDALFLAFASAFGLLALNAALPSLLSIPLEERSWVYLLRLAAFSLLIVAILWKNARGSATRPRDAKPKA